jgi:hypothetical protein
LVPVQRHQAGSRLRVDRDRLAGRVAHRDAVVDRDVPVTADGYLVAEVRDGDLRAVIGEAGDQGGQ